MEPKVRDLVIQPTGSMMSGVESCWIAHIDVVPGKVQGIKLKLTLARIAVYSKDDQMLRPEGHNPCCVHLPRACKSEMQGKTLIIALTSALIYVIQVPLLNFVVLDPTHKTSISLSPGLCRSTVWLLRAIHATILRKQSEKRGSGQGQARENKGPSGN